jgi:hypothetical protein
MLESLISTAEPLPGAQRRLIAGRMPQTFRGGMGSGDQSRSAHSRALADMGRGQTAAAMDRYRQEYQKRAETARSGDLMAQRQLAVGRYGLDRENAQTLRQQDQRRREGQGAIGQYRDLAREQERQAFVNNAIGAVFGTNLASMMAPGLGAAIAGGASPFAGMGGFQPTGLLSGLMSARSPYGSTQAGWF